MKNIVSTLVAAAVMGGIALALNACDEPQPVNQQTVDRASAAAQAPDPHEAVETDYTEIRVDNMRYDIFKLPDGTTCVATYRTDNLICNWQPKPDATTPQLQQDIVDALNRPQPPVKIIVVHRK